MARTGRVLRCRPQISARRVESEGPGKTGPAVATHDGMLHIESRSLAAGAAPPPGRWPATPGRFVGRRVAVLAFLGLTGAFGLNFAAGQFFVPLTEQRGWSLAVLTLAAGLNAVVSGLVQPVLGDLVDRLGPRVVMATSLALLGGAYVVMAAAGPLWLWLLAYGVLGGIGFAGSSSLAATVLVSHWFVRDRARVLPRVFLGVNAGQLTLVPLGGVLIERAGYRPAYLVLGLLVLVVVAPAVALGVVDRPALVGQDVDGRRPTATGVEPVPASPSGDVVPRAVRRDAVRSAAFRRPVLAFAINGWTLYLTLIHLPRYARDLGGNLSEGGRLLALAALASTAGLLAVSRLAPRWGKARLVAVLFGWRAFTLAAAMLATTTGHLVAVAVVFGLASFAAIPLITGLFGDRFGTAGLGGLLGVAFVAHQVGGGLGVVTGGALRVLTGSYDAALAVAALLLLAGAWALATEPASAATRTGMATPAGPASRSSHTTHERTQP